MATVMSSVCYNHPEKRADFKCFDCKPESIVNLCPQCNIQVHSLDIFRAHKVEYLECKGPERRLSQDVSDIEKLIAVENDILEKILTKLRHTEQEEKEMQSQLVHMQTAMKKRIIDVKDCEEKVEKAINYLGKVSSMLTQCSTSVDEPKGQVSKDLTAPQVLESSQESTGNPFEEPPKEPPMKPTEDVTKGKDVFPVNVIGSLSRNGSFWMCKTSPAELDKIKKLHSELRCHFQKNGFGDPVDIREGTICVVLNRYLKEFCRVRIEKVMNTSTVKLCFLDLGMTEDAYVSALCKLPTEFQSLPYQAVECCLFPDLDTQLPYEAKWCFKDLTHNKQLMAAIEGQVTSKNGHTAQHVMLFSCDENSICINDKVRAKVEEQNLAKEDRPLQPKVDQEIPEIAPSTEASGQPETAGVETVMEEKQEAVKHNTAMAAEVNTRACNDVPLSEGSALRVEAAEFIPGSAESDVQAKKPAPVLPNPTSSTVPGLLHIPGQIRTNGEKSEPLLSGTRLPVGCIDRATCDAIMQKCAENLVDKFDLHKARFIMVRSDTRRIVEAMKFDIWCSSVTGNRKLNKAFAEQTHKGGGPTLLLFSGFRYNFFCGVAKMVTAVDPNGSCPLLNEPFKFGSRLSGRCEIKWLYTNTVYFADVLTPELGYRRSFLLDAPDSYDLPSRLGQQIVKAFRSVDYHRSILQEALESYNIGLHQPSAVKEQGGQSEPQWTPPQEHCSVDAMSQENWDEEIEASLRAKSAEHEQTDNKIPQQVESEREEKEWTGASNTPPYSLSVVSSEADVPCGAATDAGVPLNGVRTDVHQSQDSCHSVEVALSQESVDSCRSRKSSDSDAQGEKHLQETVTSEKSPSLVETQVDATDTKGSEGTVPPHATDSSSSKRQAKDGLVDTPSNSEEDLNANASADTALVSSRREEAGDGRAYKPKNYEEDSKALASSGDHSDWEAGSSTVKIGIEKGADVLANTHSQGDWDDSSPLMVSSDVEEDMGESTGLELKSLDNVSTTTNSCTLLSSDDTSVTFSLDSSRSTGDSLHNTVAVNVNTSETQSITSDLSNNMGDRNGQEDDVLHGLSDNCGVDIQHDTCVTSQNGDQHDVNIDNSRESETESHSLNSVTGKEHNTCFSLGSCNNEQSIDNAAATESNALQQQGCVAAEYEEGSSSCIAQELLHLSEEEDYIFSPHEVLGISHSTDTCSIDENEGLYDYPVEEGNEYVFVPAEHASSSGIFWARLYRTKEQESIFVDLMKRIKASVIASKETLTVPDLHIFKPCSVRGSNGHWHRGVVEKPLNDGALVRMIDMGVCWNVAIDNLMPLANELYLELPPQAFECAIVSNSGDVKKEKYRSVKKHRKVRVVVKALNTSSVDIQVVE